MTGCWTNLSSVLACRYRGRLATTEAAVLAASERAASGELGDGGAGMAAAVPATTSPAPSAPATVMTCSGTFTGFLLRGNAHPRVLGGGDASPEEAGVTSGRDGGETAGGLMRNTAPF